MQLTLQLTKSMEECEKLINYINKQGYEIIDDSLEMELTDPSLSLTDEEVIMELQILVKKS